MRLIYIAHPFGGEQENVDAVEKIVKGLIHKGLLTRRSRHRFLYTTTYQAAWSIVLKRWAGVMSCCRRLAG